MQKSIWGKVALTNNQARMVKSEQYQMEIRRKPVLLEEWSVLSFTWEYAISIPDVSPSGFSVNLEDPTTRYILMILE